MDTEEKPDETIRRELALRLARQRERRTQSSSTQVQASQSIDAAQPIVAHNAAAQSRAPQTKDEQSPAPSTDEMRIAARPDRAPQAQNRPQVQLHQNNAAQAAFPKQGANPDANVPKQLPSGGKTQQGGGGKELVKHPVGDITPRRVAPPVPSPAPVTPQPWPTTIQPLAFLVEVRQAQRRRFRWRLALFCGLPTMLVFCYAVFVASPRYNTEFEITYQTYQPQTSLTSGLVQTFLGASLGNTVDLSAIIYEYMGSEALLKKLDAELHLREYYSSQRIDYLSRMNPHASFGTFLMYYHWYVSVDEGEGGYLTVDVQAFDPVYALALSKAIIKDTDEMIDKLTARARTSEVQYAQTQVAEGEVRYRSARLALTRFQNAHGDLNPQNSASQLGGIVGAIEGQLATQRAYLASVQTLGPRSPQVKAIKVNIAALEQQLRDEQRRLATHAESGSTPYSTLLDQYSSLQIEQEFAQTAYQSAQHSLAVARADAAQQQNYLMDFAPPHLPDSAGIYFILKCTLTTLVVSVVLFGIISLMSGALRDQMAA